MKKHALVIDDEPDIRELLGMTLEQMGLNVTSAPGIHKAKALLDSDTFDLCLTDMKLPDGDGLELVEHIQHACPQMPVAVITAHGNMEIAVEALKKGAFDFASKPLELMRLRKMVQTALDLSEEHELLDNTDASIGLVGHSEVMMALQEKIHRVARSQAPILISGESGSGKELVARAIHYLGARSSGPFVPVNCGAIPSELMESEFFGHKKGSFTGAHQDKNGLFQAANGGTLFLDEVADLPLLMQVKLLRAIQEQSVRPVGSEEEIAVDVRILSASHKNLNDEVSQNRFRQDLFYRINVIELTVPALRERLEDIPALAENCLNKLSSGSSNPSLKLSKDALETLLNYTFPGNVRELENILERACTLCEGSEITADDLLLNASHASSHGASTIDIADTSNTNLEGITSLDSHLADLEKNIIVQTLEKTRWNRTAAAEMLGLTFRQMRYKLKKLGID